MLTVIEDIREDEEKPVEWKDLPCRRVAMGQTDVRTYDWTKSPDARPWMPWDHGCYVYPDGPAEPAGLWVAREEHDGGADR